MQVIWTETALSNLMQIRAYIGLDDREAASRMAAKLLDAGNTLKTFPNRGRPASVAGMRELVVSGTPYLFVYQVSRDSVQIAHVWHSAQDRA